MRKLAIASGGFAAAVFAANFILPFAWLLPAAGLFVLLGSWLLLYRRRWLKGFVIGAFALAAGLSCFWLHALATILPAQRLNGQTVAFSATVLNYPQINEGYASAEVRLKTDGAPALRTLLYDRSGALAEAAPGDRLEGTARLSAADVRYGERYDRYNARDIYLIANIGDGAGLQKHDGFSLTGLVAQLNRALVQRVEAIFPEDTAAYFQALLLGDKTEMYRDNALYLSMSRTGFMHIVAVSGMHVAFLVTALQLMLGVGRRSSLLCLLLVWLFVLLTGGSPSAIRAAFMQTTLLMAPVLRRENDPPTSLLTALALILLVNPCAAASVSLQLSFAAMAGLMLFSEKLYAQLMPKAGGKLWRSLIHYLASTISGSLSVLVFTVPLMAYHFGYISLLSPLANVLALWTVPLCFGGGYAACALSSLWPRLGALLAELLSFPARWLFLVARLVSSWRLSVLYLNDRLGVFWLVLVYLLFLAAALSRSSPRFKLLVPAVLSVLTLLLTTTAAEQYYQSGGFITVLNVGQGQSVSVFSGENTVMIDCGSIYAMDNAGDVAGRYLLGCGRQRIDVLILTHLHADHANGVTRLMEQLPVGTIILPIRPRDDDGLLDSILLSAERQGTTVLYLETDWRFSAGGIILDLYAPGEKGDANERCITGRVSLGDYDLLFTGDIDKAAERELIETHEIHDVELLIAGHHGSRYACCGELLESIGADTAVISVGYNNFGHPTHETLARLAAYGYTVYRTDLNGSVEFRIA